MECRDIYLRIEGVPRYSPVDPEDHEHDGYRRDCMRNHGHEDARVPIAEVERRRLDAIIYREYLDPAATVVTGARRAGTARTCTTTRAGRPRSGVGIA
jgi:hypothetical protein